MSDREAILARLRSSSPVSAAPLAPPQTVQSKPAAADATAADLGGELGRVLESVGGRAVDAAESELSEGIDGLARELAAERVRVAIPGRSKGEHHAAADLDLLVIAGELAVAENAAVWVAPATDELRAALFLTEHLALVVPRRSLVPDMHAAYAAIDPAASDYGVFISGPSKTADIEQALVIGAHGPRSLTVVLVEPNEPQS